MNQPVPGRLYAKLEIYLVLCTKFVLPISRCGIAECAEQHDVRETCEIVTKEAESQQDPVIIKKYANRRLYNTDTSTYVTLDDLAAMVRSERDFVVFDAKSGEDLTHAILTQIIVDQESKGQNLLPIRFLRQLIRFYGDAWDFRGAQETEKMARDITEVSDEVKQYLRDLRAKYGLPRS